MAHGDEAFSQDMAVHFDNANDSITKRFCQSWKRQHGIRREDVLKLPYADPKRTAFRNDDRLVKTLLLSALVPEVESLRGLTAGKLAALNHGTIKSPIPGQEAAEVLRRCRAWVANGAGEIRIGEEANPTISVQLLVLILRLSSSRLVRPSIIREIEFAALRQMLFEQLGVAGEGEFEQFHDFLWRNTKRSCSVLFRNIRELPPASLDNSEVDWKTSHRLSFRRSRTWTRDDLSKIQEYMQASPEGAKTICWVPSFFSQEALTDLGILVALEHVLTGERFAQFTNHLSPQDRQAAKSILDSQRMQLRTRVQGHLDAAYGLDSLTSGSLDTTHDLELNEQYVSLCPGFAIQPRLLLT